MRRRRYLKNAPGNDHENLWAHCDQRAPFIEKANAESLRPDCYHVEAAQSPTEIL
jgi:hypothetical protein